MPRFARAKLFFSRSRYGLLTTLMMGLLLSINLLDPSLVSASTGACVTPVTNYGTVSGLVVTTTGITTNIWSRMAIPNTTNNNYLLEVDDSSGNPLDCFMVTAGSGAVYPSNATTYFNNDSSNWVNTTLPASGTGSLSAGTYKLKLIGNAPNVLVDRIILAQDNTCTPSGMGTNCTNPPDTTPPTVSISSPAKGATISGTAAITATATDNVGVTKVELYVDGVLKGTYTTGTANSYSMSVDTTSLSNASHILTAKAYDAAANSTLSSAVNVTVNNPTNPPPDTTPPTVGVTAPTSGATISATYTMSATATDSSGIKQVQFYVDNVLKSTDIAAPYSFSFDTTSLSNGAHTFKAIATDNSANQNQGTSAVVTAMISNVTSYLAADINQDGYVNYLDLSALASNYNRSGARITILRADINGDGRVNYLDLSALASKYGQ